MITYKDYGSDPRKYVSVNPEDFEHSTLVEVAWRMSVDGILQHRWDKLARERRKRKERAQACKI